MRNSKFFIKYTINKKRICEMNENTGYKKYQEKNQKLYHCIF